MTDKTGQIDMFTKSWIGRKLIYCGQKVTIIKELDNHVLMLFGDGGKICTNKNTFEK